MVRLNQFHVSGTTTIQGSYDKCPTELEIGNAFAINGDCLAFGGRFERSKFEDAQAKCQSIFGAGFTGKIWKPRSETDIEFVRTRAKSVWGSYKSAWVVDGSESSTNCKIIKTSEAGIHDSSCTRRQFLVCQLE